MYRQGRPFQGLAGGVFILFLLLAIFSHGWFLPLFFVGLGLSALFGAMGTVGNNTQSQPIYQPPQQTYQPQPPTYQPPQYRENYQEGYQPQPQARDSYQEGGQNYNYQPTGSTYEQPQPQYPPQEMPPQR